MRRSLAFLTTCALSAALLTSCSDSTDDADTPATEQTTAVVDEASDSPEDTADATADTTDDADATNGADSDAADSDADADEFPDVESAELIWTGRGYFKVKVTMSSPYDTPDQYADGWRVLTTDGEVLAEYTLDHDHQHEQPFTRVRGPFYIGPGIDEVIVEGRDSENGYGGETVTVVVPHEDHDGQGPGQGQGRNR